MGFYAFIAIAMGFSRDPHDLGFPAVGPVIGRVT